MSREALGRASRPLNLSMEYIDGEDLATLIRRIGRLPPDKGIDVARQLCAGLAAMLAAGETPSPEMVAASGSPSGLSAVVGVTCLVVLLVALCAVAALMQRSSVINNVPLDHKPEALEDTAKKIVAQLGYQEQKSGDSVYGFEYDTGYLEYLVNVPSSEAWDRLATGRPPVIHFWYRQSPLPLAPVEGLAPDVSYDDPPRSLEGMVSVRLDPDGRLLEFHAEPQDAEGAQERERERVTPEELDVFFRLAELDPKDFELSNGLRRPLPLFADSWACWHGELAGHDVDVTAASLYGKPVYFKVSWPWTPSGRTEPRFRPLAPGDPDVSPPARTMGLTILLVVCLAAVLFARRNARLGRTDPDGARKIAGYVLLWLGLRYSPVCPGGVHSGSLGSDLCFCCVVLLHAPAPLPDHHRLPRLVLTQFAVRTGRRGRNGRIWIVHVPGWPPPDG